MMSQMLKIKMTYRRQEGNRRRGWGSGTKGGGEGEEGERERAVEGGGKAECGARERRQLSWRIKSPADNGREEPVLIMAADSKM